MAGVRVRGARTSMPGGSLVGRRANSGKGPALQISVTDLAQDILAVGVGGVSGGSASLPPIADGRVESNISGATATPIGNTLTAILDHIFGSTEGQILQRGASAWQILAPGTLNQVLTSGGPGALNSWTVRGMLPLVTGEKPGPIPIADANGNFIGVPL